MRVWITQVDAHRLSAMLLDRRVQPALHFTPGFRPRHRHMLTVALDMGNPETIRIFMKLFERTALRTDEALAEHVIAIAANAHDAIIFDVDGQSTRCFTQWAGPIRDAARRHRFILP